MYTPSSQLFASVTSGTVVGAAAAEDERVDRHALRDRPTWDRSTGIARPETVKRAFGCAAVRPQPGVHSLPVQSVSFAGGVLRHAFPPHVALGRERHVGEDGVGLDRLHAVGVGLQPTCPGATPKKPASGLIACSAAVLARLDPGDVVADGGDLPALERGRRDQHREIGLAAGARGMRRSRSASCPRAIRRRGSACARRASPARGPSPRRCAARSTSCPAARCRRSPSRTRRSPSSPGSGRCTCAPCCRARSRPSGRRRAARPPNAGTARSRRRPARRGPCGPCAS